MRSIAEMLSDKEVDEMIREAGVDGDGRISYEEFVKVVSPAGLFDTYVSLSPTDGDV